MSRVLDHNPEQALTRYFHYDATNDETVIQTQQDVTDLVEFNKARYNEYTSLDRRGDICPAATVPLNVLYDLQRKGILDDANKLKRWLNDPDNRAFRSRPGII